MATPLPVVVAVIEHKASWWLGWSGRSPLKIVDAGCGDGRWLVALGLWARAHAVSLELVGVESDEALSALSARRLGQAQLQARVLRGDALAPPTWAPLGWGLERADIILHYPDGLELGLAQALSDADFLGQLWLVSAQLELSLPGRWDANLDTNLDAGGV